MRRYNKNTQSGSVLLEAILSIAVFTLIILTVIPMVSFLLKRSERSKYEGSASALLQEGIEVAYNVLLSDWNCCSSSSSYKVSLKNVSGKTVWNLISGSEDSLETRFSRSIHIRQACFDSSHNLVLRDDVEGSCPPGSTEFADSKVLTTEVSWEELGVIKNIRSDYLVLKEHLGS